MPVDPRYDWRHGIFLLLGDPRRQEATVPAWVESVARAQKQSSLEDSLTGQGDLFDVFYDEGCASLYDARFVFAVARFRTVTASQHNVTPKRVLARLGVGRA